MVKRIWAVLAAVIVAASLIVAVPQAAQAFPWQAKLCAGFSGCNAQGRGNAGYQNVYTQSFWTMYGGHNCTNYVAYRMQQNGIAKFTVPGQGNATNWGSQAAAKGIAVDRSNPQPGDIAWFTEAQIGVSGGHVAYVESVNAAAGTFIVSEDNYGGDFDWRQYNISDVSGFIHTAKPAVVTPPVPAGTSNGGKAITSLASGRCIDVNGGGTANSTQVWLYDCNGSPAQQWVYSGGALHIFGNVPKCLDVQGGIFAAGTPVQSFDCNGSAAQAWTVNGNGTITAQGWCLDADAGTIGVSGTKLQIWQCISSNSTNQKWVGLRVINTGPPTIAGTVKVGYTLTAGAGGWATPGMAITYRWYADGAVIAGATKSTMALTGGLYGKTMKVVVTGATGDLISTAASSAPTVKVAAGTLASAAPVIGGTAKKGTRVVAKPGAWTAGTTLTYRWYRDGKAISGAVKIYHTVVAADVKHKLTVRVTGAKAGYTTVVRGSKAVAAK